MNRSISYYRTAFFILLAVAVITLIKTFLDVHPLRVLFLVIFVGGLGIGWFRYKMKIVNEKMQEKNKLHRYGLLLLFLVIYLLIKYGVRSFISIEVTSQDYGIVLAFFILGVFICYYGLFSLHLRRRK